LENHTIQIEWNFPGSPELKVKTNAKIELTGIKIYRQVIEKEYIEYTLNILPSEDISDRYFSAVKKFIKNDTESVSKIYYPLIMRTNMVLSNSLLYFGVEQPVICKKVINLIESDEN
jgi:hypothetical protein